jgi:competence protein ComEA
MRHFSLGQQKFLFVLALFILGIIFFRFYYHPIPYPSEKFDREIVVEIQGEVRNPGIYLFQKSPTLREAIEKAGGLKEVAIFDSSSYSDSLETGTLLNVIKESQKIPPSPPLVKGGEGRLQKEKPEKINQEHIKIKLGRMEARKLLVFSIPLDLNRVSVEDLCLVPGVGETLAHEIVDYRQRRGRFRSVEELKNVKGIGEKKYKSVKNYFALKK